MENRLEAQQYGAPIRPTALLVDGSCLIYTSFSTVICEVQLHSLQSIDICQGFFFNGSKNLLHMKTMSPPSWNTYIQRYDTYLVHRDGHL